jgi:hypothetical protein
MSGVAVSCLRKRDFQLDILPWVYLMVHPEVSDKNVQLFLEHEQEVFVAALELMGALDIRIKHPEEGMDEGEFLPVESASRAFP